MKIIQIKDLLRSNSSHNRLDFAKALLVGKTKNSYLAISMSNKDCIVCIRNRLLSSSYFEQSKYKSVPMREMGNLLKRFQLINSRKSVLYEFIDEKILTHNILPIPFCDYC